MFKKFDCLIHISESVNILSLNLSIDYLSKHCHKILVVQSSKLSRLKITNRKVRVESTDFDELGEADLLRKVLSKNYFTEKHIIFLNNGNLFLKDYLSQSIPHYWKRRKRVFMLTPVIKVKEGKSYIYNSAGIISHVEYEANEGYDDLGLFIFNKDYMETKLIYFHKKMWNMEKQIYNIRKRKFELHHLYRYCQYIGKVLIFKTSTI